MITTLTQLEDLAESVADIGKCGVSPLISKQHLTSSPTPDITSLSETNDRFIEEGQCFKLLLLDVNLNFLLQ